MERIAEFHWHVSPPAAVDEELVVYDDGSVWLVIRCPQSPSASIGSYRYRPARGDIDAMSSRGPGPFTIDLLAGDQPLASLLPVLERVRSEALSAPDAVATFHGRNLGTERNIVLMVVAAGERPIEFEIDPSRCAVHFYTGPQPAGWQPFPTLDTGFITADASGLGGLHRRAIVPPAAYGALSFAMPVPAGADGLAIQVAGWLSEALPDERTPEPFEVLTERAEIG